jgi:hypothetical protein
MAVNVPDDLNAFLRARKHLQYDVSKCEPREIKLLPLSKLVVDAVWINARPEKDPQGDPHAGEDGHYSIPAVNLVADAEGYVPDFILLWLPEEGIYGTWDSDHAELFVFANIIWSDIAADPLPFINSMWSGCGPGVPFVPYPKYPYRPDRPF